MRLFFLVLIAILTCSTSVKSQNYLWPSSSGQFLSSTFGETRSGHFHAGLDIKTWGREGYRVFAARDGILYRLLVAERGYGNAVYLKHVDNTFTVYAHLQRFNNDFQSIADSIRMQNYDFEMDARLDSMNIHVKQGQVIGYSGSTGIGPPHLHFEVRDSLENPINALTVGLKVQDDIPPIFSSLIVEPITIHSTVEGRPVSYSVSPKKIDGQYDFGAIKVSGEVGLAANVFDQANKVYNAYAVYSLALLQASDTLFYEELNTLSYSKPKQMFLDRIPRFGSGKRGYQRMFAKDGQDNPFYLKVSPEAIIRAQDSAKTYTMVAADYFGNTSRATVTIIPDSSSLPGQSTFKTSPKDWYWNENWVSTNLQSTIDLTKTIGGFPWQENQEIIYSDTSSSLLFARITPGERAKMVLPDHRLRIRFGEQAFFDTLSVVSSYQIKNSRAYISIQPQMLATKSEFGLEFYMDSLFKPDNKYRLFRVDPEDGDLSYIDSELIGRTVHAYPSDLGEFVIQADNDAPSLSNFRIYKTDYGKWRASVHVEDALTGIDSSTAEFFINGERGIAEYDYEEEILIYYRPDFTPDSTNRAEISVKDKAGNTASYRFEAAHPGS